MRETAPGLPSVQISPWTLSDLYLIAVGGLSPLDGFMDEEAYQSVMNGMVLPNGLPWSIPVVLPVSDEEAARVTTANACRVFGIGENS